MIKKFIFINFYILIIFSNVVFADDNKTLSGLLSTNECSECSFSNMDLKEFTLSNSMLRNSSFTEVIVTNTVPILDKVRICKKIKIIDVSWLTSEAVKRQYYGESLKELYDNRNLLEENNIDISLI